MYDTVRAKLIHLDKITGLKLGRVGGLITGLIEDSRLEAAQRDSNHERDHEIVDKIDKGYSPDIKIDNIDEVNSEVEKLMENGQTNKKKLNDKTVLESLSIEKGNEKLEDIIFKQKELEESVKSFFGSEIKITGITAISYKNRPSGMELSSEDRTVRDWHLDYPGNSNLVRVLLPLTEYQEKRPLEIISKNDTKRLVKKYDLDKIRNNPEIPENEAKIYGLEGLKGKPLLFTPTVNFHRGANPEQGEKRTVLIISLIPKQG